jgi:hypothetical protein
LLSVAELLVAFPSGKPTGGVTVAVLLSVPVAPGATVPVTEYTTELPDATVAVVAMFPVPEGAAQLDEPLDEHVHVAPVIPAGIVSAI